MSPDENYLEKQAKEEEEKLHRKIKALSDANKTEIYEKGNSDVITSFFVLLQAGKVKNIKLSPVFTAC